MKMTFIAAAALVASFTMPAFAATKLLSRAGHGIEEVFDRRGQAPVATTTVVGTVHKTRVEAETAMKADKSCVTL